MDTVVYRHKKATSGEPFYIGIGSKSRPYDENGRNIFWRRTVNKYGYDVDILCKNLSWEDACELECLLISEYGRRNKGTGCLVNLTDGGEGVKGYKHTKEAIQKIINHSTGKKMSEFNKDVLRVVNKGNNYGANKEKGRTIVNKLTGEEFKSIKKASESYNTNYANLRKKLSGVIPNNTPFKYKQIKK